MRASNFGVTHIWDDAAGRVVNVHNDELLFPVFEAMSMGWSWSLYFCNEAVVDVALSCPSLVVTADREPSRAPSASASLAAVYVDNLTVVASTKSEACRGVDEFAAEAERRGLTLHDSERGLLEIEALGMILDFRDGRRALRHRPYGLWRFRLASHALLRRRAVRGEELQVWLGHATCIAASSPSSWRRCSTAIASSTRRGAAGCPFRRR